MYETLNDPPTLRNFFLHKSVPTAARTSTERTLTETATSEKLSLVPAGPSPLLTNCASTVKVHHHHHHHHEKIKINSDFLMKSQSLKDSYRLFISLFFGGALCMFNMYERQIRQSKTDLYMSSNNVFLI